MSHERGHWRVRTAVLVIAPVAVLTAISVQIVYALATHGFIASSASTQILAAGAVSYLAAAILLLRLGFDRVGYLARIGHTDSLTGLPNRRQLHADFSGRRSGLPAALAMIDLDDFKGVNEQYGHFVGDRLLKACGELLKETCLAEGRAYRLGGDEFAILVTGPIAANILESVCHTVLEQLARPIEIDDRRIQISASIGLSRSDGRDQCDSSELLRRSDMAMYVSKEAGRNRCTWYSRDFDRNRDHNQQIEADLRLALQRDEFRLLYQPLVDAGTGEIVAVEALLRWLRSDGTLINPGNFVPIAERSGLIYPIGLWVLETACREALKWDGIKLSINVSAAQLRNSEFPIALGHILEETGFPASRLELEVTETYLVTDPVVASRNLEVIRQFGVGIALDDFGTGYASIGFLRNFRFEKLKIDRSMVVDAASDDGSLAMMASSIAVARAMDMAVTAEGVETEAQAALARTAGCDQIQGWYYYKAITAQEISHQLAMRETSEGKLDGLVG